MSREKSLPTLCVSGRLSLLLGAALSLVAVHPAAGRAEQTLAWNGDEASEDMEGGYEERVRDLQNWLRQRDAERRQSWGNDVVTPENPALNPTSRYFIDRGYDARGYRQLNENTRFRLRTQEDAWTIDEDSHAGSLRRAPERHLDSSRAGTAKHTVRNKKHAKARGGKSHSTHHKRGRRR